MAKKIAHPCKLLAFAGALALASHPGTHAEAAPRKHVTPIDLETRLIPAKQSAQDWGEARAIIPAPYEKVAAAVEDYAAYQHFLPHLSTSKVLAKRGGKAVIYLEAKILADTVTIWAEVMVKRAASDAGKRIDAVMRKGNLHRLRAKWEVTPLDEGRRAEVALKLLVTPKLPVPKGFVARENAKAARSALIALAKRTGRH